MAKDAKGHGSEARGGGFSVNKWGQRVMPSASQVPMGKIPGERVGSNNWTAARALAQGHEKSAAPAGIATPPSKSTVIGALHCSHNLPERAYGPDDEATLDN